MSVRDCQPEKQEPPVAERDSNDGPPPGACWIFCPETPEQCGVIWKGVTCSLREGHPEECQFLPAAEKKEPAR